MNKNNPVPSLDKYITIFSYGSIILPSMTKKYFFYKFKPYKSVFIKGYKLILKHANSKKYPNYHNIICRNTGNINDLIPGFLVKIPINLIKLLDKWEGKNYIRKTIKCFDRELNKINCNIYLQNSIETNKKQSECINRCDCEYFSKNLELCPECDNN